MVINQLELFIVNAYNKLVDDFPYNTDQSNNILNNIRIKVDDLKEKLLDLLQYLVEKVKKNHRHKHKLSSFFQPLSNFATILESLNLDINDRLAHSFSTNHT